MMVDLRLPPKFYDDHVRRDLPAGQVVKRTSRYVLVRADAATWAELLSDARYYESEALHMDPPRPDLFTSARATVRTIMAAGIA